MILCQSALALVVVGFLRVVTSLPTAINILKDQELHKRDPPNLPKFVNGSLVVVPKCKDRAKCDAPGLFNSFSSDLSKKIVDDDEVHPSFTHDLALRTWIRERNEWIIRAVDFEGRLYGSAIGEVEHGYLPEFIDSNGNGRELLALRADFVVQPWIL